ncbi:metal-dependent hydrolase [Croceiramulus getboli]|nr:metal-dependent hydrolase [Flavobacteriaceae bacterium YJPT1-3]
MDSLTQIVLGAAVGEVVLGKKVGNKAMFYGAIAGTIPDLDVLARNFTDTITATELHRGFSHSIVFALLMAPLLGWLVDRIHHKQASWKGWTLLFFWGLSTHPLLDIFTTWGTQLFWPSEWRLAFNSIFVIDPLYTLPFLICILIAAFRKRGSLSRKRINHAGLIISSAYLLLTLVLKFAVHQQFEAALAEQHIDYRQISTRPSPLNTILWNANVETEDAYLIGDYSFFDTQPIAFQSYPKQRERAQQWIQKPNVQRLINIAQGWYLITEEEGQWHFNDLRFGLIPIDPEQPQFVFRYALSLNEQGEVVATEDRPTPEDTSAVFSTLWQRICGN